MLRSSISFRVKAVKAASSGAGDEEEVHGLTKALYASDLGVESEKQELLRAGAEKTINFMRAYDHSPLAMKRACLALRELAADADEEEQWRIVHEYEGLDAIKNAMK